MRNETAEESRRWAELVRVMKEYQDSEDHLARVADGVSDGELFEAVQSHGRVAARVYNACRSIDRYYEQIAWARRALKQDGL